MGTDREADKLKIKQILTATIVSLCNNGLSFESELCVEGLLGITLDRKDVLLVNIKELISGPLKKKAKAAEAPPQGNRQQQAAPTKQQQQQQQKLQQQQQQQQQLLQQMQQQQFQQQQQQQQQQAARKQPQQQQQAQPRPQQGARKQQPQPQEPPKTPGKSGQESFGRVKSEPVMPEVVAETETQCMAVQPYGGGYAQVQKSVKTVQNAQGVVEQKQMEWKTYSADGRVVEHKKVQEVQTMASQPGVASTGGFVGQPGAENHPGAMPSGYQGKNIKVERDCGEDMYGQEEYYEGVEQDYEDYECMRDDYGEHEQYAGAGYQDPNLQYDMGMDEMGQVYHQAPNGGRGKGRAAQKPAAKRQRKEKATPNKIPVKKANKPHTATSETPVPRNTPSKTPSKETNHSLVQRALDMVHEGKLSASTAINLFGIPKSTFYKKLATSSADKGQFDEAGDYDCLEEGWDDGMQGDFDPMDPAYANYSA